MVAPEPRPLLEITRALQQVTPQLLTPIGVNDLGALGEQMALAAITRLAPSFTIHGDSAVRLPLIDPENDNVAAVNPFLGTSGIGRPVAAINQEDRSWLDRRLDDVGDVLQQFGNLVSPLVDVLGDIAGAIIENPIARLVVVAGTWITATALCPLSGACIPIAAAASLLAIADGAYNLATSGIGGLRACSDLELASCGIQLGSAALGVAQLAAGTTLGVQLLATRAALGALAAVSETGVGIAQASGRVGVAKSDVLATLRAERV
ncbi:MAG: hypothetical protein RI958_2144, partial [Actinomycetota bacterium]